MLGSGQTQAGHAVIAVGASGSHGLWDMMELLGVLPATLPAALLFTLHRPFDRPSHLADVLQRVSMLPVEVAAHGQALRPGVCYLGEPERHLALHSPGEVRLVHDRRHIHRNATIDLLFRSVARHAGHEAIGIILSGSLADGSLGLLAIKKAGGLSMARTPGSDCGGDMPRNAMVHAGPLHFVENAAGLGRVVTRYLHARSYQANHFGNPTQPAMNGGQHPHLGAGLKMATEIQPTRGLFAHIRQPEVEPAGSSESDHIGLLASVAASDELRDSDLDLRTSRRTLP
jgi:two-component system chemotaxis response regulator CheB